MDFLIFLIFLVWYKISLIRQDYVPEYILLVIALEKNKNTF